MNEARNIGTGDNFDAVIDLGYEKNFPNGLSGYDFESLGIHLLFPLYLRNLLFPWLLMKMMLTIFLKFPHNMTKVTVALLLLLLALKLVQIGVHYTCGGGHDRVCYPTFYWGVVNLLPKGGLDQISPFWGGLLGRRWWHFSGGIEIFT